MLFLVERTSGAHIEDDGLEGKIIEGYRDLSNRKQHRSRVVGLQNDSSIEDALDAAWEAIAPIDARLARRISSSSDDMQDVQLNLLEDGAPNVPVVSLLSPAEPTVVYDTYWRFAAERQAIFYRKLDGLPAPWTADPILGRHKFTNAYRASDRVSQYLIRRVIYEGDQTAEEVFFRTILFKLFKQDRNVGVATGTLEGD